MRRSAFILLCLVHLAFSAPAQTPTQAPDADAGHEHLRAGRWAEAVAVFSRLLDANPWEGTFYANLGFALSRSGNCEAAVPVLRRGLELGINGTAGAMRLSRVILAGCAALRRDTAQALAQLDTAWRRHGLRDFSLITSGPRFASIIGIDSYRALAGIPSEPLPDRTARWRFDLAYLDRLIRQTHPAPFGKISEKEWAGHVAALGDRVPSLSDEQVVAAMMRLMARVGDGHTALYPPMTGDGAWHLLPVWPVALADGWYIGAAAPEYRSLVGGKIVGAGALEISALDTLARSFLAADNEWTGRWLMQVPFQFAQFYQTAGAANPDGSVTFRIRTADGKAEQAIVRPGPLDRDPNARWAPRAWPAMVGKGSHAPRWIRYADAFAAIEWLPKERVLYVAFNAVADTAGRSIAQLGEALRDSIVARRARGVIVDLRLNNGGDGGLLPFFLRPLVGLSVFQMPGAFQVLTGPRTYSASIFLLHELFRFTEAEAVGWPTGGRPVVYATETPFRLPLSGLQGTVSTQLEVAGNDASDARPWFAPRQVVWPTGEALRQGADPVFDAALARIMSRKE
ncbi:MAG: hypothetical protein HOP28_04470 [Gemmatimonadales bacterium]|nr:hypothetical protein [Gemmatimonadales bacterium]